MRLLFVTMFTDLYRGEMDQLLSDFVGTELEILPVHIESHGSWIANVQQKAVVVLKEGHQLTEAELIEWCVPRQAYFAIPRYIAFRNDLPKTASERVEKYKLKVEGVTDDCWDREAAGIVLER